MSQTTLQQQQQQQQKKQDELMYKIQYLKLKRITELNNRLRQELSRERITASNACLNIINYTTSTRDFAVPSIWGYPEQNTNPYNNNLTKGFTQSRGSSGMQNGGEEVCCRIM